MVNIPLEEIALNKLNNGQSGYFHLQILDKIRTWINKGYLKEGEELPSERELAAMFGVSRQPVNQAIKTLEYLGIVKSFRGQGVVVKKFDIQQLMCYTDFIKLDPERGLADLHEAREVIEIQAAKLAALRRLPEDLERIQAAMQAMEEGLAKKNFTPSDSVKFHDEVILASHNGIFKDINFLLSRIFGLTRSESLKNDAQRKRAIQQHRLIYQAIFEQDAGAAGEHMHTHLNEVWHSISHVE